MKSDLQKKFTDAVRGKDHESARQALAAGAETAGALFIAANNNDSTMVGLLLAAGADPLQADERGETPLDKAEQNLKSCLPYTKNSLKAALFMTTDSSVAVEAVQQEMETRKTITLLRRAMNKEP